MTNEELFDAIQDAIGGHDIRSLAAMFAWLYADIVADATDYKETPENISTAIRMFTDAYHDIISENTPAPQGAMLN